MDAIGREQGWDGVGRGEGCAVGEDDVATDGEGGMGEGGADGVGEGGAVGHEGGGGEGTEGVEFGDGAIDSGGETEVVGVDDQAREHGVSRALWSGARGKSMFYLRMINIR